MDKLTEREIVELTRACMSRVCTTEEHYGCPYGDEGLIDCVERLAKDYDGAVDRLLDMADRQREASGSWD